MKNINKYIWMAVLCKILYKFEFKQLKDFLAKVKEKIVIQMRSQQLYRLLCGHERFCSDILYFIYNIDCSYFVHVLCIYN